MLLFSKQTEQILRKMSWLGIGWWIRTRLTTIISHWFRSWSWIWSVICGRMGCLMLSLGSALSTTTLLLRCESLFSLLIVLLPSDEVRIRSYGHRVILIPFIFESCRGTWIVHWLELFILFNVSKGFKLFAHIITELYVAWRIKPISIASYLSRALVRRCMSHMQFCYWREMSHLWAPPGKHPSLWSDRSDLVWQIDFTTVLSPWVIYCCLEAIDSWTESIFWRKTRWT